MRLALLMGKTCVSDSLFSPQNGSIAANLTKIGENMKTWLKLLFKTPKMAAIIS